MIDFGGGLIVRYQGESPSSPNTYWQAMHAHLLAHGVTIPAAIEPGRALVGNASLLLTRVENFKTGETGNFCVVDAAVNDVLRPALYSTVLIIMNATLDSTPEIYGVVGPICESADILGKSRKLVVKPGDLIMLRTAGAYCFTQSSNPFIWNEYYCLPNY